MTPFFPFGVHDTAPRRAPQRGAGRPVANPGRPLRNLCAFGPHRTRTLAALALGLAASAAVQAQDRAHQPKSRDEVIVNGKPAADCSPQARGRSKGIDFACLNHQVQAAAAAGQPTPSADQTVTSQANTPSKVGTFSFSATSERMGKNLGHSARPYRPPAPTYSNAITAGRPPK